MTTGWVEPGPELAARIVAELRRAREEFDVAHFGKIEAYSHAYGRGADWSEAWVELAHTVRGRGYRSMEAADADLGRGGWLGVIDSTIERLLEVGDDATG